MGIKSLPLMQDFDFTDFLCAPQCLCARLVNGFYHTEPQKIAAYSTSVKLMCNEKNMGNPSNIEGVDAVVDMIATAIRPEKIYLFGSHVWGVPHQASDIDLLIVVNESDKPPFRRAQDVYRCLRGIRLPIEVVVRTRAEIESTMYVASSLVKKVLEKGTLLYG